MPFMGSAQSAPPTRSLVVRFSGPAQTELLADEASILDWTDLAFCRRSLNVGEDDQRTSGTTISEVRVQLSS
jgi:hypothetical protein